MKTIRLEDLIDRRDVRIGDGLIFSFLIKDYWQHGIVTDVLKVGPDYDIYIGRYVFYGLFYDIYRNTKKIRTKLLIQGISPKEIVGENERIETF